MPAGPVNNDHTSNVADDAVDAPNNARQEGGKLDYIRTLAKNGCKTYNIFLVYVCVCMNGFKKVEKCPDEIIYILKYIYVFKSSSKEKYNE